MKVLHDGIEVEVLEFFGVVEILIHGIGQRGVLVQHLQIQLIRPPVRIGWSGFVSRCATHDRALRFFYDLWLGIARAGHASQYWFFFGHTIPLSLMKFSFGFCSPDRVRKLPPAAASDQNRPGVAGTAV